MNKTILLLVTTINLSLYGDLNTELNKFFDSFGASANVSSAEVYNGQKAGYGTGGNVSVRNRVLNSKIATINPPKIDAGCGGIDIYAGGFSFINSEKLVENVKSIAASSIGFAFLLGVESVSPSTANNLKTLQSWANDINSLGINSCENAARLVGSVWPQNDMASQHVCRTIGSADGLGNSYIYNRHQCAVKHGDDDGTVNLNLPNLLYGDYNLAWKAIHQQGFLSTQKELAELFMTITGTVIVREVDKNREVVIVPSKITDESLLKSILEGGKSTIFTCNDYKQCLVVTPVEREFLEVNSWTGKIKSILIGIQEKILNDEELSESEIAFLASSNLPLYKIVNALTAYKHGICAIDLVNIADIIALDMLMQSLKNSIDVIRSGCLTLKNQQMYSNSIDEYIANLDRIREEIKYYETRAMKKMDNELELMKKIELIEQQIVLELFS